MRVYVTHDIVFSAIIRHFFSLFLGHVIHKTRLLLLTSGKFCLSKQSLRKSSGEENLVLFTKHNLDREMRLRCWTMRRLQNGLYHPQRRQHRWWLLKFYMVRNIDYYLHRQRHQVLTAVQSSSDYCKNPFGFKLLSGNFKISKKIQEKKKLDPFRRRDRMILKQITLTT